MVSAICRRKTRNFRGRRSTNHFVRVTNISLRTLRALAARSAASHDALISPLSPQHEPEGAAVDRMIVEGALFDSGQPVIIVPYV
jgi:hypothetical protein